MGWPADKDARCKWHPGHRHADGVCPSCLREKLSTLSSSSSSSAAANRNGGSPTPSSCSSEDDDDYSLSSSSSASSLASPVHYAMAAARWRRQQHCFKKSRSLALEGKEKKRGFWSRLLLVGNSKGKGAGVTLQSRTMRERAAPSAVDCVV